MQKEKYFYQDKTINLSKGFTLIELLVVIAIIAILATIVLTSLSGATKGGNDSKIKGTLSGMRAQAMQYNTTTALATNSVPATPPTAGNGTNPITAAAGNLFSDTTSGSNSLDTMIKGLPSNTIVTYYSNGISPVAGGAWAFAAALTKGGAMCVDYNGVAKSTGTSTVTTAANFTSLFANFGSGSCN